MLAPGMQESHVGLRLRKGYEARTPREDPQDRPGG